MTEKGGANHGQGETNNNIIVTYRTCFFHSSNYYHCAHYLMDMVCVVFRSILSLPEGRQSEYSGVNKIEQKIYKHVYMHGHG